MKSLPRSALAIFPLLLLGIATSPSLAAPDSGQRISQRGAQIGEFGSDWTDESK